jgi:hypothetical protein
MNAAPTHPAHRFSIRAMLTWIAAAALVCGTLRVLFGLEKGPLAELIHDGVVECGKILLFGVLVGFPFVLFHALYLEPKALLYDRRLRELRRSIDRRKDDDR